MNELQQPKVRLASKFERQVDRRTFVDKKGLYDGVSFAQPNKDKTNSKQRTERNPFSLPLKRNKTKNK